MIKKFKIAFIIFLVSLPVAYVVFGWIMGMTYHFSKHGDVEFGPYKLPVERIGSCIGGDTSDDLFLVTTLEDLKKDREREKDGLFNRIKYVIVANVIFSGPGEDFSWYGRDANVKDKEKAMSLGGFTFEQMWRYQMEHGLAEDNARLSKYLFPVHLQEKYPWLYGVDAWPVISQSETFNDKQYYLPYDILGVVGCIILYLCIVSQRIWPWFYYLLWVPAVWLGRMGYWRPEWAFSKDFWGILKYTFWIDYRPREGDIYGSFLGDDRRIFLTGAAVMSVFVVGWLICIYFTKHAWPRMMRKWEDFLKIDKDAEKKKELSIENVEFKTITYNLKEKLNRYAKTNEYFLAVDDKNRDITVKETLLNLHTHVLGPTGAGKTSQVFIPLSKQALNKGRGCCFIDFKGDDVFKHIAQYEAKEKGKKFYYFSIDPKEDSVSYNPLFSGDAQSKVDRIMSALELVYRGPAGFYSNVQAMAFLLLLKEMEKTGKYISFESVCQAFSNVNFLAGIGVNDQEIKGLTAAVSKLAEISRINAHQIDLGQIIKDGDVVFFALKSQVNTQLAEALGRMLIIDLKAQAVGRNELDAPFFIFIDEFQNLACSHFIDVLSKVRSANFCLVLSNQSRGNLYTVSPAFENAIFTNTATKIIFMQEDPHDARFWSDKTGQTTYQDRNMTWYENRSLDGEVTKLDGQRTNMGAIHTVTKNYITENVFLRIPFSKAVIFTRGDIARLCNLEFLFSRAERDTILSRPFIYDVPEEERETLQAAKKAGNAEEAKLKNNKEGGGGWLG